MINQLSLRVGLLLGLWAGSGVACLAETPGSQPSAAAASEDQARQIAARWVDALGGADRIRGVTTVYLAGTIQFGDAPPMELQVRGNRLGHYRYDYETPVFGTLTQAYDGRSMWQKNETLGFGPQSFAEHQANLAGVDMRGPPGWWSRFTLRRAVPEEVIEGRKLQVIELGNAGAVQEKWYFDPATGLRVRAVGIGPQGVTDEVDFSEFRRVSNGMTEAFKVVRRAGGFVITTKLNAIFYNDDIDAALFEPPASWVERNGAIETILARNRSVSGYAQLPKIRTRVTKSVQEVTTSGLKIPTTTYQKRPNFFLVEQEVAGMGPSLQGFDGRVGWAWNELQGYRTMEGAELQQMLGNADFDTVTRLGELCPLRKLLDEVRDGDRRLIGVAFASLHGVAGNFYYDARTADLVRVETFVQTGADGRLKITLDLADYRRVDGLLIPFVTTMTNPAMRIITTVQSVKHNEDIDDSRFVPKKDVD